MGLPFTSIARQRKAGQGQQGQEERRRQKAGQRRTHQAAEQIVDAMDSSSEESDQNRSLQRARGGEATRTQVGGSEDEKKKRVKWRSRTSSPQRGGVHSEDLGFRV